MHLVLESGEYIQLPAHPRGTGWIAVRNRSQHVIHLSTFDGWEVHKVIVPEVSFSTPIYENEGG